MNHIVATFHVRRFQAVLEEKLGLSFGDDRYDFLVEILQGRLEKLNETCDMYLSRLENQPKQSELITLGRLLTVPETYFFRHYDQFEALIQVALPERIHARRVSGRLSILSAGCASGEEVYSLAVLAREAARNTPCDISILGIDINPEVIQKAVEARYSARSLRQTTTEMQQKLFGSRPQDFVLDENLRKAVRFEVRNLVEDDPDFWRPEFFDIIFCRNVIMYFSMEQAQAVVSRLAWSLVPGGYLFLGHAENLRGLSQDFHVCHTHDTFYYRRYTRDEVATTASRRHNSPTVMPTPLEQVYEGNTSWFDAIQSSAERVQSLSQTPTGSGKTPAAGSLPWSLGQAFDLLHRERFDEALTVVRSLPPEATTDPDAVLLHAVLCAHRGLLAEAEQVSRHLLQIDELNAGAHYVLAICCEGAGDIDEAVSHDQTAVYLDPSFAMPRLHLGLLARRAGDMEFARRELQQALLLLQREEISRLLLFGGGFGREALVALCRAELTACGGSYEA